MQCFLCGAKDKKFYLEKKNFKYFRCGNCGLISLEKVPENLSDYYSKGYFTGDLDLDGYMDYESEKELTIATFKKYLNLITKANKNVGSLFEVGCATGCFLDLAKNSGWSVAGMDISSYATDECKKKGLDVSCSTLEDFNNLEGGKYDAVAMFDVIEHLVDPVAGLKKINGLLKTGGLVAFATPDSGSLWASAWKTKWHAFVPPQHINLFSVKNVKLLLQKSGFEPVFISHYGKTFAIPYIFRLLNTWTKIKFWRFMANFSANNKFLKNISIPINLGDTMFVIAKKIN